MDTSKWKSILVPREIYESIKATAKEEGRTISGQLRVIFESYTEKVPDAPPVKEKPYNPKKDSRRRQSVYE
jgi:predicted DNA-binding protein